MGYRGDVLVVAGDKVMDPPIVRKLLRFHRNNRADLTVATASQQTDSTSGFILTTACGQLAQILEEPERQRLIALKEIAEAFQHSLSSGDPKSMKSWNAAVV